MGIYVRISRDREGAGLGVERQEQDCRALARKLGWRVVDVYSDNDLSAYSGKPRPNYKRMLADVHSGRVDAVIVWHTDRLHRSPTELEEYIAACEPRAVPTQTVKAGPLDLSTASGRMVARQLGAVARYEVEHMIERQLSAKAQAAAAGRWKGGRRPFGYEADGVTVRPIEATAATRAAEQVLAGRSLSALAREFNSGGIATSTGREWTPTEVKRMLIRPRNAGLMEHRGQIIGDAEWPAILDRDTWFAVRAVLTAPERRTNAGSEARWLLSGIALCGVCADGTTVKIARIGTASGQVAYSCRRSRHMVKDAPRVEEYVTEIVAGRLRRSDVRALATRPGTDTSGLHVELDAYRKRLDDLAGAFADGDIDARQMREGSERLRLRVADVEARLAEAMSGSVFAGIVDADDPGAAWVGAPLDQRRAILDALARITLHKSGRGRPAGWRPGEPYMRPETIEIEWVGRSVNAQADDNES